MWWIVSSWNSAQSLGDCFEKSANVHFLFFYLRVQWLVSGDTGRQVCWYRDLMCDATWGRKLLMRGNRDLMWSLCWCSVSKQDIRTGDLSNSRQHLNSTFGIVSSGRSSITSEFSRLNARHFFWKLYCFTVSSIFDTGNQTLGYRHWNITTFHCLPKECNNANDRFVYEIEYSRHFTDRFHLEENGNSVEVVSVCAGPIPFLSSSCVESERSIRTSDDLGDEENLL